MKKGDIVKIKTYDEISETLLPSDSNQVYDRLLFVPEMIKHCDKTVTLGHSYRRENRFGYVWNIQENTWIWHEDWLEPKSSVAIKNFLKDEDFEI